jgi:protein SCO1/2
MKRYFSASALVALALFLTACSRTDQRSATTNSSATAFHDIRGEIVSIERARGVLLIHHEEIPGYMPAMTMEFTAPGIDLSKLREGQRLTARMGTAADGVFPLTQFRVLNSQDDQAVTAAALALRQDTFTRGKDNYREIGETAPSFTLYNQDGRATSFDHFRGKRVVLNFIFTRCPIATMCPASTAKMMSLQAAAKEAGVKNFELVSISFDSAYDTPPVLKQYAAVRGIDTTNFSFLTGPENAIRDLLEQFGVIAEPSESIFKHSLSTLLIDEKGKIIHRVDGSQWTPDDFLPRLRR